MSANGEDKENVENEMQDKDDKQTGDKGKSRKKKDKKGGEKKNDPTRFQGAGLNFKAKLIGIESVPEARGDKMCQEALQNLKAVVKAAGEHKQRIIINVSLEGLKILDDKSGTIIHHHAVHKISFISRDAGDSRAFGYIYGLGEGKHDFFGIKTEKPAEGLVLALRDLFQTVFEIKKREVELQKQKQLEEEKRREQEGKLDGGGDRNGTSDNDPFATGSDNQGNFSQNNIFSQDVFAPSVPRQGFADFHSLPGSGPPSGNESPLPPRAQSSVLGFPVQQDPFKNDPFFSGSQPSSNHFDQAANDKYAALAALESLSTGQSSAGSLQWESPSFGAFANQPKQESSSAGDWPGTAAPTQPAVNQAPVASGSPVTKVSDPFAALDSLGGNKPLVDKKDFFKPQSASPTLSQMSGNSQSNKDFFGTASVSDPFASAPFVHTSDKDVKDLDPFDTSSVLLPSQRGPYDTSQLKPKLIASPATGRKLNDQQSDVAESEEYDKFDFNLPSPTAPPPPLPTQMTVKLTDIGPAPPPRPRPRLTKAQTIDIPDMPPPAIPPRPSSRPSLGSSSSPRTSVSSWLEKSDLGNESPKFTRSNYASSTLPHYSSSVAAERLGRTPPPGSRTPPAMRHTPPLTRGMSTPSPSVSGANRSPIAISRPRPRPRPRTPGSSSSGTPSTLEQLPESVPAEAFSRETVTRQSDKLDDHVAARRLASTKTLVRNQSEPTMVTPTEDPPPLPAKEVFGSDPAVSKPVADVDQLSDVSSVDRQSSYSSSFKDSFKLDPFASAEKTLIAADPFAVESPPDPFSNSFCGDQNELFQTKAVVCDTEVDPFENDPFGCDPFGSDVVGSSAVSTGSSDHTSEHLTGDSGRPGSAGQPLTSGHMDLNKDITVGAQSSPGRSSGKHSVGSAGPQSPSLFSSKMSGSSAGASDQGFFSDQRSAMSTASISRDDTQDSFGQDYVSINWGDSGGGAPTNVSGPGESSTDDPFSTDFVKNQPILTKKTTLEQLKDESSPVHSRPSSVERPGSASSIDPNDFFPARQGDPFAAVDPLSRRFGTPPAQHQPKAVFQWSHSSSPPIYRSSDSPRPDWPSQAVPTDPYMANQSMANQSMASQSMASQNMAGQNLASQNGQTALAPSNEVRRLYPAFHPTDARLADYLASQGFGAGIGGGIMVLPGGGIGRFIYEPVMLTDSCAFSWQPVGHPAMAGMQPHSGMSMTNGAPMGASGMPRVSPQYPQMYSAPPPAPMTPPPHMQQVPPRAPAPPPGVPPRQQPPVGNPFFTNQWPQ